MGRGGGGGEAVTAADGGRDAQLGQPGEAETRAGAMIHPGGGGVGAGQPRPRPRPMAPHLLGQGRSGGGGAVLLAGAGGRGHALPRRHRARDEGRDPRPDAGPRPRLEAERRAGEVSGARGLGEVRAGGDAAAEAAPQLPPRPRQHGHRGLGQREHNYVLSTLTPSGSRTVCKHNQKSRILK